MRLPSCRCPFCARRLRPWQYSITNTSINDSVCAVSIVRIVYLYQIDQDVTCKLLWDTETPTIQSPIPSTTRNPLREADIHPTNRGSHRRRHLRLPPHHVPIPRKPHLQARSQPGLFAIQKPPPAWRRIQQIQPPRPTNPNKKQRFQKLPAIARGPSRFGRQCGASPLRCCAE